MRRSMLFLPGNTPNIIQNGEILGADAVILDLEDAVAPTEKDSARILVRNAIKYMGFGKCEVIVRINCIDTDFWTKDLDAIMFAIDLVFSQKSKSCFFAKRGSPPNKVKYNSEIGTAESNELIILFSKNFTIASMPSSEITLYFFSCPCIQ